MAVIGPAGIGKTLLCCAVLDRLDRRTVTSVVSNPRLSVEDLLKTMLVDFGVISGDKLTRGALATTRLHELMTAIQDFLMSLASLGASAVVFIDQAHELSADALEQICSILAISDQRRLIQFVLVGRPALETVLGRPQLRRVRERVALECRLGPLMPDEIEDYVAHRLAVAGNARVQFRADALKLIQALTGGIPKLVNALCDRALGIGFDVSAAVIDAKLVRSAAIALGLVQRGSVGSRIVRGALTAGVLLLLMGVGAAASVFVFRSQFDRAVMQWKAHHPLPSSPVQGDSPPSIR
jgi:general secretion pathway protein A